MKVFSASEAIRPALARTYDYLFRTFQWETFLKLAAVATLSEGFIVSFKFFVPNTFPFDVNTAALKSFLLAPAFLPVTILGAAAILLLGLYCLYLITRLRFGFIHCLIHQTREIRAASKLYSVEAESFFTACVLVWLTLFVLGLLAIALFVVAAYGVIATPTPEGKLDPGSFFILFFPCLGIAFALILAACVAQVALNDFILPHMAIEGASFRNAWTAARTRIAANRETFFSYFILRLGMPLAAGLVLGFAAWVLGLIVFGILGMSAAGFTAMLDGTTDARAYLLIAAQLLFILLGLGAGSVLAIASGGPIGVFTRSYALFFYGGHYKALGNLLNPPDAPAASVERETKNL
ncbi:MAG TPA: hypothetical protein VGG56_08080 [Terracidiphilus sp.]|jgi:hypothetical protein